MDPRFLFFPCFHGMRAPITITYQNSSTIHHYPYHYHTTIISFFSFVNLAGKRGGGGTKFYICTTFRKISFKMAGEIRYFLIKLQAKDFNLRVVV